MLKSLDKQLLCELLFNNVFCLAFSSNFVFCFTWVYVSGICVFLGILPDHEDGHLNTFSLFETWSSPLIPHTFTTLWLYIRCVQHVCMYNIYIYSPICHNVAFLNRHFCYRIVLCGMFVFLPGLVRWVLVTMHDKRVLDTVGEGFHQPFYISSVPSTQLISINDNKRYW